MSSKLPPKNYLASLLGGAIGDALGAPVEFLETSQIKARFGSKGVTAYVEFADGTGEFTDDTQMTLFTAEGLLRAGHRAMLKGIEGATTEIVYESYLRWLDTQGERMDSGRVNKGLKLKDSENGWLIRQKALFKRRAPGNTCLSALKSGISGTMEEPINGSKGCGGIMRMAPVGLMFPGRNKYCFRLGAELAAITHGHPAGYLSAGFFASVISDLAAGEELQAAINNALALLQDYPANHGVLNAVTAARSLYFDQLVNHTELSEETLPAYIEQLGGAWVGEEALAISLYCSLLYENDFEKGVLAAVNHSGDSDSTGSITGNLLGLINGLESIPGKWITNLRSNVIVRQVAEDLHTGVKGGTFETDREWWDKYPGV